MSELAAPDSQPARWPMLRVGILLAVLWLFFVPWAMVALLPLAGALVRYRAHYRPRRQATDIETKLPVIDTIPIRWYHSVFPRVWALEGWAGLWKGLVPCILYFVTWSLFKRICRYSDLGWLAVQIAWLPFSVTLLVVMNREITHPQALDWARWKSPSTALLSLFTRSEQAHPQGFLYRTFLPLLVAEGARTAIIEGSTHAFNLLAEPVGKLLEPHGGYVEPRGRELSFEFLAQAYPLILAGLVILLLAKPPAALILCPLEVVITRISLQAAVSEPEDEAAQAQKAALMPTHEPVIQLRNTQYDGPIDCVRCMVREEGWRSLYRAFWMTLLFTMHGWTWNGLAGWH